jgi:hypothetical protein
MICEVLRHFGNLEPVTHASTRRARAHAVHSLMISAQGRVEQ